MTISVTLAARLALVPRSWLRRAIKRGDYRVDALDARAVRRIREDHDTALLLRGRHDLATETRGDRVDALDGLAIAIEDLGARSNDGAVAPDEARALLDGAAELATATNHPSWARALRRASRTLQRRRRRTKGT